MSRVMSIKEFKRIINRQSDDCVIHVKDDKIVIERPVHVETISFSDEREWEG